MHLDEVSRRMTQQTQRAIGMVVLGALLFVACKREGPLTQRNPVRVAAASDLTVAFEEVAREFERSTGRAVSFTFGSTGLLAKQLRQGAPFDVFAAANLSFVDEVVSAGVCDAATNVPYARGRIAIWTKRSGVVPPSTIQELGDTRFARIALANPAHAPYGQAAQQALHNVGLWDSVAPKLVYAENVRQALQFAQTGNVDVALIALALVVDDRENPWHLVEERHHHPIDQALVVCKRGGNSDGGAAFARFVDSERGRLLMRRYGFLRPGETLLSKVP